MRRRQVLALGLALALGGCDRGTAPSEITLASAASLRAAVPKLARAFEASHKGVRVTSTFGASGDLERQVEAGAPVDAVLFAAAKPVDKLAASGRVDAASRRVVATNELVLIGPAGKRGVTFATLESLPPGERLAVGDPASVPAGDYAKTWLTAIGKWEALRGRLVFGSDVSAVLAYARRGEVAAAIVYATEARGIGEIIVLDEARGPEAPHPEVVAAIVTGARGAVLARDFLGFVASPEGQGILTGLGFGPGRSR